MTVSIEDAKETFQGNGAATAFGFDFKVNSASDLQVIKTAIDGVDQTLTLNVHYAISLNGNQNTTPGGTVIYPIVGTNVLALGERLTVLRAMPFTQPTAFTLGVLPSTLESKVDNLTLQSQQLREAVNRALQVSPADAAPGVTLGTDLQRANKYMRFDASGNIELVELTGISAISQQIIGALLYPRSAEEIAAGVSPVDYSKAWHNVLRFIPVTEQAGIAAGTSTYDCADAIDATFLAAGAAAATFPKGTYYTSRGIAHGPTMHIIAHEATIRKTTNAVGTQGIRTFNGANDDYNVDYILALLHSNGAYGRILVEGRLQLRSGAASPVAFGLYIPRFFYSSVRNVNTQDCATGVRGMTGILSDIVNVQCFGLNTTSSPLGIQIVDFAVPSNESTSLNFNACWGVDVGRAYHIAATYTTMVNCAADRCGTETYRFDSGSVTLVGCGTEGGLHAPAFYFNGGRHRAVQCRIIQPHSGAQARGLVFVSTPGVVDAEFICDNFTDAGSALRYEVNAGATLRVNPGNIWPTNGNSPVIGGVYREFWTYAAAPPAAGTHVVGERVYNTAPVADTNGWVLDHWLCTVAGSPGTWAAQYQRVASVSTTSGTYTPTLTNVANLDGSTAFQCQYLRVANVVTVSGRINVNPTAGAGTLTQVDVSLPVPSNFSASENCGGAGSSPGVAGQVVAIFANSTDDRASIRWLANDTTDQSIYFSFTYLVQ